MGLSFSRESQDQVVKSVIEAGRLIEAVRNLADRGVSQKPGGPVSAADRQADAFLRGALSHVCPDAAWLSEETADSSRRLEQRRVWVVDPLDGTKEFLADIPEYSIAVALVTDGIVELGVVHNPATGDLYSAALGKGAFRNGERVHVAEGNRILASRSEVRAGEFVEFVDWQIEAVGSIALKMAMIGSGLASVTVSRGPKWEWDVAAGSILVTEGGGAVSDMFGNPLAFNQRFPKVKGVLAGANQASVRVRQLISGVGPTDRMLDL